MYFSKRTIRFVILVIFLSFSALCFSGCNGEFLKKIDLNAKQINIDELCKYNIFLYEGVTAKNIGVPIILEYEEGYKQSISDAVYLKDFSGENIEGIGMQLQGSLYKWVYNYKHPEEERIYIEVFAFSVFSDNDYSFSQELRTINRVVFGIGEREYPVNVEIKITDKSDYKGQYNNFKVVSLIPSELTEIPAFSEDFAYEGQSPVIKSIRSEMNYYNVLLKRYKKYVPKKSGEGVTIKVFYPNELNPIYLRDFAFFDIDINRAPRVNNTFCTGDMLIFEVGEENSPLYTDEVWGLYSFIDFSLVNDIAKAYLA